MTDEQILEMIEDEKSAYEHARKAHKKGFPVIARVFQDLACDLTVKIDRAHQEVGV